MPTPHYTDRIITDWWIVESRDKVEQVTGDFRSHTTRLALVAFLRNYWTDCSFSLVYNWSKLGDKKLSTPQFKHIISQPIEETTHAQFEVKNKLEASQLNIKKQALTERSGIGSMRLSRWFSQLLTTAGCTDRNADAGPGCNGIRHLSDSHHGGYQEQVEKCWRS